MKGFKVHPDYLKSPHKGMRSGTVDVLPCYRFSGGAPFAWEVRIAGEHIDGFKTKSEAMTFAASKSKTV